MGVRLLSNQSHETLANWLSSFWASRPQKAHQVNSLQMRTITELQTCYGIFITTLEMNVRIYAQVRVQFYNMPLPHALSVKGMGYNIM